MGEIDEGIKQNKTNQTNKNPPHRHRKQYSDYHRGRRVGQVQQGIRGINVDGRRLELGW